MNDNSNIPFYQQIFNILYYMLLASIMLGLTYAMTQVALSAFDAVQDSKLALIDAETRMVTLKEGISEIFRKDKEVKSYSFESWTPVIISWTPFIIKYLISLFPIGLFKLPYIGKVITFVAWATTEASQIPVEPDNIRKAIGSVNNLIQNYDAITEATKVIAEAHTKLDQETFAHKNHLDTITDQLSNLRAKVDFMYLETSQIAPGRGAALPMRSSDAVLGSPDN
uniref:Orf224 n=1 Tax=Pseudochorda nagaii TaxID=74379 RepID=A0A8F0K227_9PHAE|nr:orf224 [Pseudochorda nagaii]